MNRKNLGAALLLTALSSFSLTFANLTSLRQVKNGQLNVLQKYDAAKKISEIMRNDAQALAEGVRELKAKAEEAKRLFEDALQASGNDELKAKYQDKKDAYMTMKQRKTIAEEALEDARKADDVVSEFGKDLLSSY